MKPRNRSLSLWALLVIPGLVLAQDISMTSRALRLGPVSDDAIAFVRTRRTHNGIAVGVLSEFNCDTQPVRPRLLQDRNAVTISVASQAAPGDPIAAICVRELSFVISGISPAVKTIYYVQDGHVMGHASAP